jgi:hypothetical protein
MAECIFIEGLRVEFISSKMDNYDNMISYFKIMDPLIKQKLKIVNKMSDTLYKPFWKTDKKETMLKVKTLNVIRKELVKETLYDIEIQLVPFFVDKQKTELKGYSAKVFKVADVKNDVVESEEEEED